MASAPLIACATAAPEPGRFSDPTARVKVERLARGTYSISQVASECRPRPAEGRRERLIALAESMWVRFGRKERSAVTEARNPDAGIDTDAAIAGFWTSIPPDDVTQRQWQKWRDQPAVARQEHWSAAFTSWLMCEAGLSPAEFALSYRHSNYVAYADAQAGLAAHRLATVEEAPPEPGDLLCASTRGPVQSPADPQSPRPLHCSLVVQVSAGQAEVIGGNVDGAVARIRVRLEGYGTDARVRRTSDAHWLWLMKLRDRH